MPQLNEFVHVRDQVMAQTNVNALIDAERSYSIDDLEETLSTVHMLNAEQRVVYDTITAAVDNASESDNNFFFLDGPGGTGKSYLLEKILAYTRRQSKIALATASSGIAALLLTGGKTVHSMFKLPLTLDDRSQCAITVQSKLADLIRQASLIVWDEASMGSRYALEAIDRALQDVVGVQRPFGAKVMLLCGDFRQILPIVPKGTDAQIISQCLKKSPLWEHCQKLSLSVNMRVQRAPNSHLAAELQEFAEFLLSIGEGRHPTFAGLDPTFAKISLDMMLNSSTNQGADVRELIDKIYPEIERWYKYPNFFTDRAILSPLNVDVTAINNAVMMKLPEVDQEYLSVDTLVNPEEHEHLQLPPEYLNSLNISGIPLHSLKLKQFAPVLLLRNLHTERGLCNGTR
ncbi:ATP-dependent DNA helicase PIF1-like [Anopheles ziemanni]|uniref:ATP-dependent DNA helicase PIF1-like n=1 Tax=Anopheles coustani TaxID=139045 RepID=UPI00265B44FB|nr:ATP-dependent DNA helicase PIF1-like [Anopheles coustani]XP_058177893.1 ATP-dependent DNA helicase PIF1-like [Anopheles ziemanni]